MATIKSRRSATINAQVDGYITRIVVHSGDHVKVGQPLMDIDPIKQQSTVESQVATESRSWRFTSTTRPRWNASANCMLLG